MVNDKRYTTEEFIEAVKNSTSIRQALFMLGLKPAGGNYSYFKKQVKELNLDISHFTGQSQKNKNNRTYIKNIPLEHIFTDKGLKLTHRQKRYLINNKLLGDKCSICSLGGEWNNKPLTLEIDHINGNSCDNRIEKLRLLCPNCHSQTPNFRNKKRKPEDLELKKIKKKEGDRKYNFKNKCLNCGVPVYRDSLRCKKCKNIGA